MKREDFKEITKEQIEFCKEIVKQNGKCEFSGCKDCPFSIDNNTNSNAESCTAYTGETATYKENALAVKSAMEFIKLFEKKFIKKEKRMFEDAQVGDRVWDFIFGWGTIKSIIPNSENPIQVTFDNYNREHRFDLDGKYNLTDINPFLFWDEIKFNIPEKPFNLEKELKKLEVIKFECGEENFSLHWDHEEQEINITCVKLFEKPSYEYFTRESIEKFKENIKNKKITKEQFFKAYEKVFRQSKEE